MQLADRYILARVYHEPLPARSTPRRNRLKPSNLKIKNEIESQANGVCALRPNIVHPESR
jgi:hypothetical protein